jgi:hypothetical protein
VEDEACGECAVVMERWFDMKERWSGTCLRRGRCREGKVVWHLRVLLSLRTALLF